MFDTFKIGYAIVTENDDSKANDGRRLGRIQARLLPEMEGVDPEMLPWLRPLKISGMKAGTWSIDIPQVGSKILVAYVDDFWKDGYYLGGFLLDGLMNYDEIHTWVQDTMGDDAFIGEYPNVTLQIVNRQVAFFTNKNSGYVGVVHKSGSYMAIDANGNLILKGKGGENVALTGGRIKVTSPQVVIAGDYTQIASKFFEVLGKTITMKGKAQPDANGDGGFCAIPKCLFAGAPHVGMILKNP